jgi:hypothetical protein
MKREIENSVIHFENFEGLGSVDELWMPHKQHNLHNFALPSHKGGLDKAFFQANAPDAAEFEEESTSVLPSRKDKDLARRMVPYVFNEVFVHFLQFLRPSAGLRLKRSPETSIILLDMSNVAPTIEGVKNERIRLVNAFSIRILVVAHVGSSVVNGNATSG